MESKFYIDIESKIENEWLQDIYSAITRQKKEIDAPTDNLIISMQSASDEPKAVMIVFEPQFWAEQIGFKINTSKKILSKSWQYAGLKGMQQVSVSELSTDFEYGIKIHNHNIKPKVPFIMGIMFEEIGNPNDLIVDVSFWNGEGGNSSMQFINFSPQ